MTQKTILKPRCSVLPQVISSNTVVSLSLFTTFSPCVPHHPTHLPSPLSVFLPQFLSFSHSLILSFSLSLFLSNIPVYWAEDHTQSVSHTQMLTHSAMHCFICRPTATAQGHAISPSQRRRPTTP